VLAHGHQTELETLFGFGGYNYPAPDGAGLNDTTALRLFEVELKTRLPHH
jgi:hypothetical protein